MNTAKNTLKDTGYNNNKEPKEAIKENLQFLKGLFYLTKKVFSL